MCLYEIENHIHVLRCTHSQSLRSPGKTMEDNKSQLWYMRGGPQKAVTRLAPTSLTRVPIR